MTSLPAAPAESTAEQACETFRQAGWSQIGVGDWSWVLGDQSGTWAARITPFDPAYRIFADDCLSGPANRWLPRLAVVSPLARDGFVVVMERLWSASEGRASAFCAALAIGNDSGYATPRAATFKDDDADLASLRARLRKLLAKGASQFRLWGGSDVRPGNVMTDGQGRLKLVDPIFLRGRDIVDALLKGRRDRLSDFSRPA